MVDKNKLLIKLIATLDSSKAIADFNKLKKLLKKDKINLQTNLDVSNIRQTIQRFAIQIQKLFKQNVISINTSKLINSLDQIEKQADIVADRINKIRLLSNNTTHKNTKNASDNSNIIQKKNHLGSDTKTSANSGVKINDISVMMEQILQKKLTSGGLMRLITNINKSPFLATVEFNSNVYDSYFI